MEEKKNPAQNNETTGSEPPPINEMEIDNPLVEQNSTTFQIKKQIEIGDSESFGDYEKRIWKFLQQKSLLTCPTFVNSTDTPVCTGTMASNGIGGSASQGGFRLIQMQCKLDSNNHLASCCKSQCRLAAAINNVEIREFYNSQLKKAGVRALELKASKAKSDKPIAAVRKNTVQPKFMFPTKRAQETSGKSITKMPRTIPTILNPNVAAQIETVPFVTGSSGFTFSLPKSLNPSPIEGRDTLDTSQSKSIITGPKAHSEHTGPASIDIGVVQNSFGSTNELNPISSDTSEDKETGKDVEIRQLRKDKADLMAKIDQLIADQAAMRRTFEQLVSQLGSNNGSFKPPQSFNNATTASQMVNTTISNSGNSNMPPPVPVPTRNQMRQRIGNSNSKLVYKNRFEPLETMPPIRERDERQYGDVRILQRPVDNSKPKSKSYADVVGKNSKKTLTKKATHKLGGKLMKDMPPPMDFSKVHMKLKHTRSMKGYNYAARMGVFNDMCTRMDIKKFIVSKSSIGLGILELIVITPCVNMVKSQLRANGLLLEDFKVDQPPSFLNPEKAKATAIRRLYMSYCWAKTLKWKEAVLAGVPESWKTEILEKFEVARLEKVAARNAKNKPTTAPQEPVVVIEDDPAPAPAPDSDMIIDEEIQIIQQASDEATPSHNGSNLVTAL